MGSDERATGGGALMPRRCCRSRQEAPAAGWAVGGLMARATLPPDAIAVLHETAGRIARS